MTVGPAHVYIEEGISKGYPEDRLEETVESTRQVVNNGFPPVLSLKHLSHYTGVKHGFIHSVVRREYFPYESYKIKKRSGGFRFIHAPYEDLKTLQRWISSEILYKQKPHARCFSFHSNASIKDCAAEHCQSKWLIKIDVERFFESISEIQVYKLFRGFGYKPLVAFEMSRICTISQKHVRGKHAKRWVLYNRNSEDLPYKKKYVKYIGRLPQGAPTSPQLSNLIFSHLDEVFSEIAARYGWVYTRYADDLAFSTRKKGISRDDALLLVHKVNSILIKNKFNPQHKKLKIISPGAKKVVLGLIVDSDAPRLAKDYKKNLEAHVRGLEKFGPVNHATHRKFNTIFGMIEHVRGLITYGMHIEPTYAEPIMRRFVRVIESCGLER